MVFYMNIKVLDALFDRYLPTFSLFLTDLGTPFSNLLFRFYTKTYIYLDQLLLLALWFVASVRKHLVFLLNLAGLNQSLSQNDILI